MSKKEGVIRGHKFHGDPKKFEVVADFVAENYKGRVKTIADVAGGQGMLCRILAKKYNFDCEVIDPRGFALVGVKSRPEEYNASISSFYNLIVGLHPDEATRDVVCSALTRPVLIIPCCNFWTRDEKLGRDALIGKIEDFYEENNIKFEKHAFDFEGPKNIGLISTPPNYV